MNVIDPSVRVFSSHQGRSWRLVVASVMGAAMLSGWWASSAAAAAPIKVDTTAETAVFNHLGSDGLPTYPSEIIGSNPVPGLCSLREAIDAINTHASVAACTYTGDDTIELMAGTYHILDNFFIERPMKFIGPNAGLAGNDPKRGPEAVLSFDYNPNWAAQVAMFWLDQPQDTGDAKGAGTVFDGIEMRGGFKPDCAQVRPCEIAAIVQPSKIDQQGYTLTNSILRDFSYAVYLGGRDTITRDVFEDNDKVPSSSAFGWDIYSDFVYTAPDPVIDDNVFKNPDLGAIILQGDENRGTVFGGQVEDNLFLKRFNHDLGLFLIQTTGVVVKDNLFFASKPAALPDRGNTAIRMDRVDHIQITGNTITGWGSGIKIGGLGSGTPGTTDTTINFNRIYNNLYGVQVTATTGDYAPLSVDATDNWWGANGGPGSTGARPGAINPVNGVQFVDSDGNLVSNQGGIIADPWLRLTCSVPATVQVNVPAPVVGQVVGMPTVDVTSSTPPWFVTHADPLMAASAPGIGNVLGFDQVPDQGPDNAQLTGTLLATNAGSGDVLVDLDSERVACPLSVTPGPEAIIDKDADSPTVTAGGLAGYRIAVTNRSGVTAQNWWVCDRIPRAMTFVGASRKLRRLGRLQCLVIPTLGPHHRVSFHLTLRVVSDTPNTTVTNIAEVIPGNPGGGTPPAQVPIAKVKAKEKVRVLHQPLPPPVTG